MTMFVVEVNHGGLFVHEANVDYVSTKVDRFYDYDSESWSMIKYINLVQLMSYAAPNCEAEILPWILVVTSL